VLEALDVIAIHQLLARYHHLLDDADWDGFARLWRPEATIDYVGSRERTERQGREAIVEWFRQVGDSNPSTHLGASIVVDLKADGADPVAVRSRFLAPFTRPAHGPKRLYGGDYHDLVHRSEEGWQFAHRRCVPSWQLSVPVDETAPAHRRTY
jgi:3-phenylpropionate/cinnamic acid dioxygenase small subunit